MSLRSNASRTSDHTPTPRRAFKLGVYLALALVFVVGILMYLTDSPAPLMFGVLGGILANFMVRASNKKNNTQVEGGASAQVSAQDPASVENFAPAQGPEPAQDLALIQQETDVPEAENEALAGISDGWKGRLRHTQELLSWLGGTNQNATEPQSSSSSRQNQKQQRQFEEVFPVETAVSELLEPICGQDNPLEALCMLVGDLQTREATQEEGFEPPTNVELFLVAELLDSGLLEQRHMDAELRLVRPSRSNMYYLRIESSEPDHETLMSVLAIEAALNRAYLLSRVLEGESEATARLSLVELYQVYAAIEETLTREAATKLVLTGEKNKSSEAEYRIALANQLESWLLPYRLTADFRCNVAAGIVNLRFNYTPEELFQKHIYNADLLRQVPSTTADREQLACTYNLRVGALLAAGALIGSDAIHTVRIACASDDGETARTYFVAEFKRGQLTPELLHDMPDPVTTLRALGVELKLDQHKLLPTSTPFELESPDVCPKERYLTPEISNRVISESQAQDLGSKHVSDLSISESAKREELAKIAGRHMDGTAQGAVRALLNISRDYPDPSIELAVQSTIAEIIDGDLSPADTPVLLDRFVEADPLTGLIKKMVHNGTIVLPEDWESLPLADELARIDATHTYDNTPEVRWACFRNYTERVLYNLSHTPDEVARTRLVPDSYFEAHLMAAGTFAGADKYDRARAHAERCLELNPYDGRAHMLLINLHLRAGFRELAILQAKTFLDVAYSPVGLGHAYHSMSHLQYQAQNLKLAEACMRKCLEFSSPVASFANMELSAYLSAGGHAYFSDAPRDAHKIDTALRDAGIPVAPSDGLLDKLLSARNQALNAEIFPAARNIAVAFAQLTGDDVSYSVAHSIESEPDRLSAAEKNKRLEHSCGLAFYPSLTLREIALDKTPSRTTAVSTTQPTTTHMPSALSMHPAIPRRLMSI